MIKEYLQNYNYDEKRFVTWVKSQGHSPHDAMRIVATYANSGKIFGSGNDLCTQLLNDLHDLDMEKSFLLVVQDKKEYMPVQAPVPKEEPKEILKEEPKEEPEKMPEEAPKEEIKEELKEIPKEESKWVQIWHLIRGR